MRNIKRWSKKEIVILKKNFEQLNSTKIQQIYFPYRTVKSIQRKLQELNIYSSRYKLWNSKELNYLMQYFGKISTLIISKKLDRNIFSIYSKAEKIGLKCKTATYYTPHNNSYSKKEDKILKQYWKELQARNIKRRFFPNRTECSIKHRANRIGLYTDKIFTFGKNNGMYHRNHTFESKKKMSFILKKLWQNPEYAKKQYGHIQQKPTMPEIQVLQIIKLNNLPFNYTGNNKVWINGHNPDFLSKNPKHIIEVNGERWHQDKNRERRKKYAYSSLGYKMLTIWVRKIKKNPQRVTEKIVNFITS